MILCSLFGLFTFLAWFTENSYVLVVAWSGIVILPFTFDDTFPLMMVGIPWVVSSSELHYLLFLPVKISIDLTMDVDLPSAEPLFFAHSSENLLIFDVMASTTC